MDSWNGLLHLLHQSDNSYRSVNKRRILLQGSTEDTVVCEQQLDYNKWTN